MFPASDMASLGLSVTGGTATRSQSKTSPRVCDPAPSHLGLAPSGLRACHGDEHCPFSQNWDLGVTRWLTAYYRNRASVHSRPGHRTWSQLFLPRTRGGLCEVTTAPPSHPPMGLSLAGALRRAVHPSPSFQRPCPGVSNSAAAGQTRAEPSSSLRCRNAGLRLAVTTSTKETCCASKRKGMSNFCNVGQLPMTARSRNPSRTRRPSGSCGGDGGREQRGGTENHFFVTLLRCHSNLFKQARISSENKEMHTHHKGVKLLVLVPGMGV